MADCQLQCPKRSIRSKSKRRWKQGKEDGCVVRLFPFPSLLGLTLIRQVSFSVSGSLTECIGPLRRMLANVKCVSQCQLGILIVNRICNGNVDEQLWKRKKERQLNPSLLLKIRHAMCH